MKVLMFVVMACSATAMADMIKPINTNDLTCVGKLTGKKDITLSVTAKPGLTKLVIKEAGRTTKEIVNNDDLTVGSEGNVYIQQVSNEAGYNLYLTGKDLVDVLNKDQPKKVNLTGNLDLFEQNSNYALKCSGTLY